MTLLDEVSELWNNDSWKLLGCKIGFRLQTTNNCSVYSTAFLLCLWRIFLFSSVIYGLSRSWSLRNLMFSLFTEQSILAECQQNWKEECPYCNLHTISYREYKDILWSNVFVFAALYINCKLTDLDCVKTVKLLRLNWDREVVMKDNKTHRWWITATGMKYNRDKKINTGRKKVQEIGKKPRRECAANGGRKAKTELKHYRGRNES